MAMRTYTISGRKFDIHLSGTPNPSGGYTAWSVEHVYDGSQKLNIPGMQDVAASDENTAFAKACSRIDKWLGPEPTAGTAPQFTSTKPVK